MNVLNKRNLIFIFLSIIILIACVLPVIINKDATITKYSFISIVFAFCSVVYAVIAFILKEKGNLFTVGRRFWRFVDYLFAETELYTKTENYKKEFAFSAFIFCASIPLYIPFAFFAKSFYTALSSALSVTIIRLLLTFVLVLIPRILKNAQNKKQGRIKDEADKREQERREELGGWK